MAKEYRNKAAIKRTSIEGRINSCYNKLPVINDIWAITILYWY
jgi:hypothetical protein